MGHKPHIVQQNGVQNIKKMTMKHKLKEMIKEQVCASTHANPWTSL
jgi:hypothetical protein